MEAFFSLDKTAEGSVHVWMFFFFFVIHAFYVVMYASCMERDVISRFRSG